MTKQILYTGGRPNTTAFRAARTFARTATINTITGKVYNRNGEEVGSTANSGNETRVTVHLQNGKKYGVRVPKLIAYVKYGPEALRRGVRVEHINGDTQDHRAKNLALVYNRAAAKAYRRRLREAGLA